MKRGLCVGLIAMMLCAATDARIHRSTSVRANFVKLQACPSTHSHKLPCKGWEIDHIEPLCAGGIDKIDNLQWLTVQEHRLKTRTDVRVCNRLRREILDIQKITD